MNRIKISPSLLAADFSNLKLEIEKLKDVDLLHFDIMDGHYVPNLTFGIPLIKAVRKITSIPFDVHLMVTNPSDFIDELGEITGIEYISYHQETEYHNHRLIHKIKQYNIKAGWAINPANSIDCIKPVLEDLDFVLLMSVNPGFGGQTFIPSVIDKILQSKKLSQLVDGNLEIEVDGGVNDKNSSSLIRAGANILVAGSYIFNSSNYSEAINKLHL